MLIEKAGMSEGVINDICKKMSVEYGVPVEVTRVNPFHYSITMTDTVHNKSKTVTIGVNTGVRKLLGILDSLYLCLMESRC